jgi:hypothetical protein
VTRALRWWRIADAIFNGNDSACTDEPALVASRSSGRQHGVRRRGILTAGPQPGIALWPSIPGQLQDTIIVANSGGTELSVIDARAVRRPRGGKTCPIT